MQQQAGVTRRLERYFEFEALGTNWRTEILAGVTTFLTMAYIVFVNPSILGDAGMPKVAVLAATCVSAALGSIFMGVYARYPIALAPGMAINAYFAYAVVKGMGMSWQAALGTVFLAGVAFIPLTLFGIRQLILSAVPAELHASVAAGIGLFLAVNGLRGAGLVAPDANTLGTLGDVHDPNTLLALFGLLLTSALMAWRVRAAILIGITATTAAAALFGLAQWQPQTVNWSELTAAALQLDLRGALSPGYLEVVFAFLFVILFDNIGTLVAVTKKAGLMDANRQVPRVGRILLSDASATVFGSLTGTSPVVSYIESAAGVSVGGRSGVTAIVAGLLFLVALLAAPLVGFIPAAATAPALIVVGVLMVSTVAEIEWSNPMVAMPAFLTMVAIPLTASVANGIAIGFIAWTALKVLRGEWRTVSWLVYVLTVLFILRFAYLGGH